MIELMFKFANEIILVVINGNEILFGNTGFGSQLATIDGLRLNYQGVIREHPDLETEKDWEKIAKERFKKYIKLLKTEIAKSNYIIDDLKKYGYEPMWRKRKGFRFERLS